MPALADIDIHLPGILLAYTVLIVGIFRPGPAVLAIIGTALNRGRMPSLQLATGVVCGSAFWGVAAAAGMSAILASYAYALTVIKIAGGLYLLWLASKSLRSAMSDKPTDQASLAARSGTPLRMWTAGLLLHLTNPKAIMAWLATIALGVTASSPIWVSFAIVLGGIVISTVGNLAYAVVFSTRPAANLYLRARRPIEFVFASFFGLAGIKLLMSRS
ncbi:MAG: LysE family translocator [Aestuariivirgaceae bacterium]